MLKLLSAMGFGIVIGTVLIANFADRSVKGWGLAVGGSILFVFVVFDVIRAHNSTRRETESREAIAQARAEGRIAYARVEQMRRHSTESGETPVISLDLTVQPHNAKAYRTDTTVKLDDSLIPRFARGSTHEVVLYGGFFNKLGFTGQRPGYTQDQRVTISTAHQHIPALPQSEPKQPTFGTAQLNDQGMSYIPLVNAQTKARKRRNAVINVVGFVLGLVIVALPHQGPVMHRLEMLRAGHYAIDLRTPDEATFAVNALIEAAGHDYANEIILYPQMIRAEMPLVPGQVETDSYDYRGASVKHEGAATIQPRDTATQFQLSAVAWEKIMPQVLKAAEQENLPADDVYIFIDRETTGSASGSGPIIIRFSLDDDYHSVTYQMNRNAEDLTRVN